MSSRATAPAGRGPTRLPVSAPARTAALKMAIFRIRMRNPPKGLRRAPKKTIQASDAAFTLIKRAAGGQGFARPRGPIGHQPGIVSIKQEQPQFDFTKWPRMLFSQQLSFGAHENGG